MTLKHKWNYGENRYQIYWESRVGEDVLCVFANKSNPETWMAMVNNIMIYDKTGNDKERRKYKKPMNCRVSELPTIHILCNSSPEYMMEKAEYCYAHRQKEINR